jgi:hypothetical protein
LPGAATPFPSELKVPDAAEVCEYDRNHLAIYAALLDAADREVSWDEAAAAIMGLDVSDAGAEACWRSHLERARWIVGEGLAQAIEAFSRPCLDP